MGDIVEYVAAGGCVGQRQVGCHGAHEDVADSFRLGSRQRRQPVRKAIELERRIGRRALGEFGCERPGPIRRAGRLERDADDADAVKAADGVPLLWQTLPLDDDLAVEFAIFDPESDGYWFPWRTRSGVYKWLRPLSRKLGVSFTPHMARHEFGGRHREAGATSRDLVDIGSWTSQRSTERYQGAPTDHARTILHDVRGTSRGKVAK